MLRDPVSVEIYLRPVKSLKRTKQAGRQSARR